MAMFNDAGDAAYSANRATRTRNGFVFIASCTAPPTRLQPCFGRAQTPLTPSATVASFSAYRANRVSHKKHRPRFVFVAAFYSPIPDVTIALYRFDDPAIPGVVLPPSGNSSPGDIQLNHNNSIVQLDGSDVQVGCNGDVVSGVFPDIIVPTSC